MRNLLTFIYKNYFFFLFLLLEFSAVYLVVKYNYYHRAGFVNSSNAFVSSIYNTYDKTLVYFSLNEKNEVLAKENASLRSQLISSYVDYAVKTHHVTDSLYKKQYEYIEARVVNNSTNRRSNYLTLNRGKKQGIEKDMAVVSSSGIVGEVDQVSDNFCTVMSILHKDVTVNAEIKKDGNFGFMTWDGGDSRMATITGLPTHTKLAKGDTVVTSHISFFPANIMIGTIVSYGIKSGETSFTVSVRLCTEFNKLGYVYVVKDLFSKEQKKLEEGNKYDK
jgi:rod shape-determining protein MreC